MARRSDHTREELQELLIVKGHRLMAEEGFHAFSARKVAAEAGYTVGTIYHVFGSLDMLILYINARTLDDWFDAMTAKLKSKTGKAALRALADGYLSFARKHYFAWDALFSHRLVDNAMLPDWYAGKMLQFFDVVESLLQPLCSNKTTAKRSARVLWSGIHGVCTLALGDKLALVGAESADTLMDDFLTRYLAGLAA